MTISIWRLSHLVLALASSIFLLVASITGVILAVEPISHQAQGYAVQNLSEVSLATAITGLRSNYDEVFSMEVESSGFVKASVLTVEMETLDIYIDAASGDQLGEVQERPAIYSFATNLHRSLFLKSIGRFFVGLISLLLFLIAVTGLLLLAQRQGGFKRLFSKVQKDYFELRYHVILSRWFFIPIVILALTGVYLSAEKFDLLPDSQVTHQEVKDLNSLKIYSSINEIPFFKETTLNQVRRVEFPFSDDPEEYYEIAFQEKELRVNQQTGQILSSASYPFVQLASQWSWSLHTGEGNVWWSVILLLASASILFFIYSGIAMFIKRRSKTSLSSKMPDKDDSEFIILVGSETGTTYDFATRFYNGLTAAGKKVYLTEMNNYTAFAKAEHIIIFTATYGDGEPPTNARKFVERFLTVHQPNKIKYSVVGFGSLEYPAYCKFAIQTDALLQSNPNFQPLMPLQKINNASAADFQNWVDQFSTIIKLPIKVTIPTSKKEKQKLISFEVTDRTGLNVDDTFLIKLKPKSKQQFTSGDLLSIFPPQTEVVRQYSIARINNELLLSVKKHEHGLGSNYLYELETGTSIKAAIDLNPHFHFPKKTKSAILIANGTGIAPFLGMLNSHQNTDIHLFWGGKTRASSNIYDSTLNQACQKNTNLKIYKSYSREENEQYIQELVSHHSDLVLQTIQERGIIMICGSLAMQHDILDLLENLLKNNTTIGLDDLQHNGQLKMDCY
ncbi:sulfite reductase (NADPH) flavoprotein alpha-component [Nonlabens sp. Hel1_33_55]|uniref:PepSY domain-containing protein n=1 Tax=Nonlabens sp. Hel1_33_55 TaxID=1336802 RepID=UPI000875BF87|nr:PepSY domain-containing protein [Nonlabens sp. Hel1_33_55]SCX99011.1 sulfite reductase (NADPH) flavoprotein alpha-component [Nonlabens sp. Hel1_33_55]